MRPRFSCGPFACRIAVPLALFSVLALTACSSDGQKDEHYDTDAGLGYRGPEASIAESRDAASPPVTPDAGAETGAAPADANGGNFDR